MRRREIVWEKKRNSSEREGTKRIILGYKKNYP
jgi:hypothetical protein